MQKNKFTTYLLYAFGEIVLVVIGILIAVSINNWNQERAKSELFEQLVVSLEKTLEEGIEELEIYLSIYEEKLRLGRMILDPPQNNSVISISQMRKFMSFEVDFTFLQFDVLDQIQDLEYAAPKRYAQLFEMITYYEYWLSNFIQDEIAARQIIEEFDRYLIRNMNDYSNEDIQLSRQKLLFYSTDPTARNWIYKLTDNRSKIASRLTALQSSYLGMIAALKVAEDNFDTEILKEHLKDRGLEPPTIHPCDQEVQDQDTPFFFSLYFNYTSTTKVLNRYGTSGRFIESFSLLPGEFHVIGRGSFEEVTDSEGNCELKLSSTSNAFVLID